MDVPENLPLVERLGDVWLGSLLTGDVDGRVEFRADPARGALVVCCRGRAAEVRYIESAVAAQRCGEVVDPRAVLKLAIEDALTRLDRPGRRPPLEVTRGAG